MTQHSAKFENYEYSDDYMHDLHWPEHYAKLFKWWI